MQKSYLNILNIETGEVKLLHTYDKIIEAPNWNSENNCLYFNSEGRIYKYDIENDTDELINTGDCTDCNNDHVLSPDLKYIAVSNNTDHDWLQCRIHICPIEGGAARAVTDNIPSFLHGWSNESDKLCYCAFRNVDDELHVDIYTIPSEGGVERRLTNVGFNDGPEFDPSGKHIWYNSTASGLMQIWRMNNDGSDKLQMTDNEMNNWFAHVSPDGKKVIYLAFRREDLKPEEHLPNLNVQLWLMDYDGSNKRKMLDLFGGQGTINVNSWSGDSKHLAFVSYEKK